MKFEWDVIKNKINIEKHKISFKTAELVFDDPNAIEIYDFKNSIEEDRYIIIGFVNKLLSVVYVERSENIRIISARKANEKEEALYYDN